MSKRRHRPGHLTERSMAMTFWATLEQAERVRLDTWQDVEPALCSLCNEHRRGVLLGVCAECMEERHGPDVQHGRGT